MMNENDIANDCIKYCLIKARGGDVEPVIKKIAKALYHCDMSSQSMNECMVLLKVLRDEG